MFRKLGDPLGLFSTIFKVFRVWNRAYFRCFHRPYFFIEFRMIFQTKSAKTRKMKKLLSYYKIPCFVRVSLSLGLSLSQFLLRSRSLSFPLCCRCTKGDLPTWISPSLPFPVAPARPIAASLESVIPFLDSKIAGPGAFLAPLSHMFNNLS